jgi:hypothetical protein
MILVLKTPYNPGDADPGKLYTHLHLELMVYNASAYAVQLSYAYGCLDKDDVFASGKASALQSLTLLSEDLAALQKEMAGSNEPALPASIRLAYEHLKTALGVEGTLNYDLPATPPSPQMASAQPSAPSSDPSAAPAPTPAPSPDPASSTPPA